MMGAEQSHQETKPDQDKRAKEAADQESSASTPDASQAGKKERCDWSDVKNRNQLQTEERELKFSSSV